MKLASKDADTWKDRTHFIRTAAVAMRRILMDRAREKSSLKRGGAWVGLPLSGEIAAEPDAESHVLIVDECLARMEKEHPDCARVVQLKFFAGRSNEQTAALLGSSLRTVERQWSFARDRLYQMIRGHEGDPVDLSAADIESSESLGLPDLISGRFRILGRLGEGGGGVVFIAEQAEPVRHRKRAARPRRSHPRWKSPAERTGEPSGRNPHVPPYPNPATPASSSMTMNRPTCSIRETTTVETPGISTR